MWLILCLAASALAADNARDIVREAMERDQRNLELLDTYMFERRTLQHTYEKDGRLKKTTEEIHEVFHVDGTEIERLIRKDGKELTDREKAAEQRRIDKVIQKIRNESPKDRAKRRGEREKDREEEKEARREVLDAFDFQLLGEEPVRGRECWKITGQPRGDFRGKGRRADQMKKVSGAVWIDKQTYELVRMNLDTKDTISFGWFLLRLQPGAQIRLEQQLINQEVWLPVAIDIRADARVLGKMLRVGLEMTYDKFRKFQADSQLIVTEQ